MRLQATGAAETRKRRQTKTNLLFSCKDLFLQEIKAFRKRNLSLSFSFSLIESSSVINFFDGIKYVLPFTGKMTLLSFPVISCFFHRSSLAWGVSVCANSDHIADRFQLVLTQLVLKNTSCSLNTHDH